MKLFSYLAVLALCASCSSGNPATAIAGRTTIPNQSLTANQSSTASVNQSVSPKSSLSPPDAAATVVLDTSTRPPKKAFYYWRTTFSLTAVEKDILQRHHVERLYLRFFDVAWDWSKNRPLPVGRLHIRESPPSEIEIVPVVFLTNSVFEHRFAPEDLAKKVWNLAESIAQEKGISFSEMQVDCDWSDQTRAAFFSFCQTLKKLCEQNNVQVSATIRLHQIKYSQRTGVPPVNRGMLMFYNMGRLSADPQAPSSIFNEQDASRYVQYIDQYPLPLDAALAVFSWLVHLRDDQIVNLIEKVDLAEVDAAQFVKRVAPGRFCVLQSTLFHGRYLEQGDLLKAESMSSQSTKQSAQLLAKYFHPAHPFTLALFELDERNLKNHAPPDLENTFSFVY